MSHSLFLLVVVVVVVGSDSGVGTRESGVGTASFDSLFFSFLLRKTSPKHLPLNYVRLYQ